LRERQKYINTAKCMEARPVFHKMMNTEIDIKAPAESVWNVLTDFSAYPQWNPMIRQAAGEPRHGARLKVRFEPEGVRGRNYSPRLIVVEPGRELRWQGRPRFPLFFDMEHYWIISEITGGKVRLLHGMSVSGLLAIFATRTIERTRRHFENMNRAHRERAEKGWD
jgi:hypothetical protein